jgi:acyl carrier protein
MNAIESKTKTVTERLRLCLPRLTAPLANESTTLGELALDSMDTVEFLCAVHLEFGVRLTESEFHSQQTIGGLLAAIASRSKTI